MKLIKVYQVYYEGGIEGGCGCCGYYEAERIIGTYTSLDEAVKVASKDKSKREIKRLKRNPFCKIRYASLIRELNLYSSLIKELNLDTEEKSWDH